MKSKPRYPSSHKKSSTFFSNRSLTPAVLNKVVYESPKGIVKNLLNSEKIGYNNPSIVPVKKLNSMVRRHTPVSAHWNEGLVYIHKLKAIYPKMIESNKPKTKIRKATISANHFNSDLVSYFPSHAKNKSSKVEIYQKLITSPIMKDKMKYVRIYSDVPKTPEYSVETTELMEKDCNTEITGWNY
jgi:hypothetical protein